MSAMHRGLIRHELGHALVGLLHGLRIKPVYTPRPPDVPPDDLDAPAGFLEFHRGWDPRAKALALLGGPLAEGKAAPTWPIEPRTDDERMLARIGDGDEVTYLEHVRDAETIVESEQFIRMHRLASELLEHAPPELTGEQLDHIREATTMDRKRHAFPIEIIVKSHDGPPADVERDELGVIADAVEERDIAQLRGETEQTAVEADPRHALARREWEGMTTGLDENTIKMVKDLNAACPRRADPEEGKPAGPGQDLRVLAMAELLPHPHGFEGFVPVGVNVHFRYASAGSSVSCALGTGVTVSSSARSWKLRSRASGDAEAAPHGCRAIRTTWRVPPHRQRVAEDSWRGAKPSL